MKNLTKVSVTVAALLASASLASAECGIEKGSVRILSNDFEALHLMAERAEHCASGTVEVTKNQTAEHKNIQVAALTTNPATYTVAVVANGSLVPLLNEGLVRPLDDLVAQYGQGLQESQLIRIDGKVMAVAFRANAQHMHYRKSVLEAAGIEPPKTYEDVLAGADALREAGVIQNPILTNFKPGWDLGEEFINMYLGHGGEFFEAGTAIPAIQGEAGIATLNMMKALSERMSPDFVTYNTNEVGPIWLAGDAAYLQGWGSRTAAMIDAEGPSPEVAADTVVTGALTVGGGTTPAATLWWDGFAIAKNISDEDAAASFQAMVHAIAPELASENPAVAAWLIEGYQPTPAAIGVFETVAAGAQPYPMLPYMGLLHTALGDNLSEFLQGQESAEQALADAVAAYTIAATEGGFLK